MPSLEKAIKFMVNIAEDNSHGYSQKNRQSPDYDCSSLVLNSLKAGGFDVNVNGYTGNMPSILSQVGFEEVEDDNCLKGDIFLTPYKHVVMAYADNKVVTASGDKDGKTGDSSGKEIYKRNFYIPSYGWSYHFRYIDNGESPNIPVFTVGKVYELTANVNVRIRPGVNSPLVGYANLTLDGQKHDKDKNGSLDKGTHVTCQAISVDGSDIWMAIPSGFIAVYYKGKYYAKEVKS